MSRAADPRSCWAGDAAACALRAWSRDALAELGSRLEQVARAWADDWGIPTAPLGRMHCESPWNGHECGGHWKSFRNGSGDAAWLQWGSTSRSELARALFGVCDGRTPVVGAVLVACRDDASQRLATALRLSVPQADAVRDGPPANAGPWSGMVWVSLPWGGRLVLEAGVVQPLLGEAHPPLSPSASPALVRVTDALARYPTRLQAHLDPCEFALAELQDLRPGDVLRLSHRVNAPVSVGEPAGENFFEAWLARRAGLKAVELAAPGGAETAGADRRTTP